MSQVRISVDLLRGTRHKGFLKEFMAKGRSTIQGIYPMWRAGKKFDSLRVAVRPPNGAQVQISSKVQPTLKQINEYPGSVR